MIARDLAGAALAIMVPASRLNTRTVGHTGMMVNPPRQVACLRGQGNPNRAGEGGSQGPRFKPTGFAASICAMLNGSYGHHHRQNRMDRSDLRAHVFGQER